MPRTPYRVALLLALIFAISMLSGCGGPEGTKLSPDSHTLTNTQHTGIYNTTGPRSSPDVAWKFKAEGEISSSPAVAGSILYFGSEDTHLYALDAATGQFRWKLKTGNKVRSSPVVHEGVVYVGSDDGALYAADANMGAEKWKAKTYGYFIMVDAQGNCCEEYLKSKLPPPGLNLYMATSGDSGWGIYASPVITGDKLYFGADSAYFYAADVATGEIAWVETAQSGITSNAAVDGDAVYFVSDGGGLFSLDTKTGRENWRFYTQCYSGGSSVVVMDGTIYVAGDNSSSLRGNKQDMDSTLWAVDAATGKEKWSFPIKDWTTAPIVSGRSVYITGGKSLYAVDAQTGAKLWEFDTGHKILDPPILALASRLLYLSNADGSLYAIDAETGHEVWKFKVDGARKTAPAVADGMLYFGSADGYIYALK
ncbi:MAG TPA: PQQ-binding-like beta-propeller repeat protein [Chloroflexia bacterium]|nr:PQQ-binding-like beta-propeller repeat protein [Chloroflexia bacterium]